MQSEGSTETGAPGGSSTGKQMKKAQRGGGLKRSNKNVNDGDKTDWIE